MDTWICLSLVIRLWDKGCSKYDQHDVESMIERFHDDGMVKRGDIA